MGIRSFFRIKSRIEMRQNIKIPRILKINWIKDLAISVVYNNGESRIIDFRKVLKKIGVDEKSPAYILYDTDEFAKAEIQDNTLSWSNVEQYITMRNGEKIKVSSTKNFKNSFLATGFPYNLKENPDHCIDKFVNIIKKGLNYPFLRALNARRVLRCNRIHSAKRKSGF